MSETMRPIPFHQLMDWILTEYHRHGTVFGVSAEKMPRHTDGQTLTLFGEQLEAPYGPAAGPNTQLCQNIVAAYTAGARFFELKTVQIMDGEELARCIARPCIAAADECYNCEWSTELTVPQAMDEYIKAWFACKLLARELELGNPDAFIFNLSVGYDLAGIRSPKLDSFIEGLKDASATPIWAECRDWALAHLSRFGRVDEAYVRSISPRVSRSITLSTLHGCPPDEIERIAAYLITEKGLHTFVKCNPTLLGYDFARKTLDSLGFSYVAFDDHHFREDLQLADALPMFRRLQALSRDRGLTFGVKLTNTCPVDVTAGELPSQEMYMSGRALYPLTVSLAALLSRAFGGQLRISYSGGADVMNIRDLYDAGIWPVTMATTVLKPGGYERFCQIGGLFAPLEPAVWAGVDVPRTEALAAAVPEDRRLRKPVKPIPDKKLAEKVPLLDCFTAPCHQRCPIHQDIPAYLKLAAEGRFREALTVILRRNALPFITGTICPHPCSTKCMRGSYDDPIHIRKVKLQSAREAFDTLLPALHPKAPVPGLRAAVVGGGPAGMAAAFYLAREGVSVTLFEAAGSLGGIVRQVIPGFRIPEEAIDRDAALLNAMGVRIVLHHPVDSLAALQADGFTHILLAVGARLPVPLSLEKGEALQFMEVLAAIKAGRPPELGQSVAVIGGGNSAMDTARAIRRLAGVEHVYLVYRRDERNMPADEDELQLALADGVEFRPLLAPVRHENGQLLCRRMELGPPDASGRRAPTETDELVTLRADAVVAAIGQKPDHAFLRSLGLPADESGAVPVHPDTAETKCPGVYIIGDAHTGPRTVVEAMADATRAVSSILGRTDWAEEYENRNADFDPAELRRRRGRLVADFTSCPEGERCLGCAAVCETCVSVCPNRANIAVTVPGMAMSQIIHVDGMCNECGNCATFCPYDSRPYRDKFTLFWSREDFENSENQGFLPAGDGSGRCTVRLSGETAEYDVADPGCGLSEPVRRLILAVRDEYGYLVR